MKLFWRVGVFEGLCFWMPIGVGPNLAFGRFQRSGFLVVGCCNRVEAGVCVVQRRGLRRIARAKAANQYAGWT